MISHAPIVLQHEQMKMTKLTSMTIEEEMSDESNSQPSWQYSVGHELLDVVLKPSVPLNSIISVQFTAYRWHLSNVVLLPSWWKELAFTFYWIGNAPNTDKNRQIMQSLPPEECQWLVLRLGLERNLRVQECDTSDQGIQPWKAGWRRRNHRGYRPEGRLTTAYISGIFRTPQHVVANHPNPVLCPTSIKIKLIWRMIRGPWEEWEIEAAIAHSKFLELDEERKNEGQ